MFCCPLVVGCSSWAPHTMCHCPAVPCPLQKSIEHLCMTCESTRKVFFLYTHVAISFLNILVAQSNMITDADWLIVEESIVRVMCGSNTITVFSKLLVALKYRSPQSKKCVMKRKKTCIRIIGFIYLNVYFTKSKTKNRHLIWKG